MTQYEREEQQLEEDLRAGRISMEEYIKEAQEMERSYRVEMREMADAAADSAYNDVIG